MSLNRFQCGVVVALALTITTAAAQSRGLRILVIAGADAVNIIQQKTAVAPVVEVRDRNGQPVAGAAVKFAIKGGRASFKGARTVSVMTNAAGHAEASGLTPTGSGAFQITASATFQGETAAAVTIAQTNVMAAVQAAQIATAVGAETSGAAGGAGAGVASAGGASATAGGGGLSTLAVAGIVGGAVAGGAITAKHVLGGGDGGIYEGEFRIDVINTTRDTKTDGTVSFSCTSNVSFTGEVRAEIDVRDGTVTGTVSANGFAAELSRTCPFSGATSEKLPFGSGPATGTTGGFQASCRAECNLNTMTFSGALNGGVITGTFTLSGLFRNAPFADGTVREQSFPATSTQVTLTK